MDGFDIVCPVRRVDITLRVFRDLGIAFGIAVLESISCCSIKRKAISAGHSADRSAPIGDRHPSGFWLLNAITGHPVGLGKPCVFTATA